MRPLRVSYVSPACRPPTRFSRNVVIVHAIQNPSGLIQQLRPSPMPRAFHAVNTEYVFRAWQTESLTAGAIDNTMGQPISHLRQSSEILV